METLKKGTRKKSRIYNQINEESNNVPVAINNNLPKMKVEAPTNVQVLRVCTSQRVDLPF